MRHRWGKSVCGAIAVLVGGTVAVTGPARVAEGHTCAQVERVSPPSTVVGNCEPHEPLTHDCAETGLVLLVTTCTDVPAEDR